MSYVQQQQQPLSFDCHTYSCATCQYCRVEFVCIKNPPVTYHGRLFKPDRLSAPDEENIPVRTGNLTTIVQFLLCLLACSLP